MSWKVVIVVVAMGIIAGIAGALYMREVRNREFQTGQLKTERKDIAKVSQKIDSRKLSEPGDRNYIEIPLTAGWKPQGPGATGGGYRERILELRADLKRGDSFVELFLDLRHVNLPGIGRNPDGSYNLAGKELSARVRSDWDFRGQQRYPNGAQFLLKNETWENHVGTWFNVSDAMITPEGMDIFYSIPDDKITRRVVAITIKFTIGSHSTATYKGSFFVHGVEIRR